MGKLIMPWKDKFFVSGLDNALMKGKFFVSGLDKG